MKDLVCIEKEIGKHSAWCFQISFYKPYVYNFVKFRLELLSDNSFFRFNFGIFGDIFNITCDWTKKEHHAGFLFDLNLCGLIIHLNIYDGRHWDSENDCWEDYTSYESLKRQGYTDEEIAEAHILPSNLSEEEIEKSNEEFSKFRMERLKNMTPEEIELSKQMQKKFKDEQK